MDSRSKHASAIKVLAAFALCVSLYWLWMVFVAPWIKFMEAPETDARFIVFIICMPILMGLPAFFGLYFGWRGIRKTDVATVKGLVASYCLGFVWHLAPILSSGQTLKPSDALRSNLVLLLLAAGSVCVYLLVSRHFLRALGHSCPPLRQSLPAWLIGLTAFILWQAMISTVMFVFPIRSQETATQVAFSIGAILGVTLLAVLMFKLGVWLFAGQNAVAQPGDRAGS